MYAIKCNMCGDVIVSKHRHDFVTCSCQAVSLDGGGDPYVRILGEPDNWEEVDIDG